MTEEIKIRAFQKQDIPYLEEIVRKTWKYDRFASEKTAKRLAKVFLASCLTNQTFIRVAALGERSVGVIMAKDSKSHRCPLGYRLRQVWQIFRLMITKEGRQVSSIFRSVNDIDQILLQERKKAYQGELAFFAIGEECRGKGNGAKLFAEVRDYMRQQGVENYYLYTDTSCNFGFYEHMGMQRCGEKKKTFEILGQQAEMQFYLYEDTPAQA